MMLIIAYMARGEGDTLLLVTCKVGEVKRGKEEVMVAAVVVVGGKEHKKKDEEVEEKEE